VIVTEVTVDIAVAVMEGSAVAVAVMVTAPGVDCAVQTVTAPLAVCVGLNEPQGEGVQVQSTPLFCTSFVTVAAIDEV